MFCLWWDKLVPVDLLEESNRISEEFEFFHREFMQKLPKEEGG